MEILTKTSPTFEVKSNDPALIDSLELSVLYGVFKTDEEIRSSDKPLILVTASYDFLSIAPTMGKGINAASGIMAVYDLSRIFSQLLEDPKLRDNSEYDFMFVLTPGSFMNYELSGQFIESLNDKIKEKVKFVLSLDSLAYSNDLSLYFGSINTKESKRAKDILVVMREAAAKFGKNVKFVKKPSPGNFHEWEHLRYSEKGFFAGTLTSHKAETFDTAFDKFSVFDNELNFDRVAYEQNLKIISEFLSRLIFTKDSSEGGFISENDLVDTEIQSHLISFFAHNPRIPTMLSTDSKITQELLRLLKFHLKNTKTRRIRVNNPKFYLDSTSHKMRVYGQEGQVIDLIVLFAVLVYLTALYYTTRPSESKVKQD